MKKLLLATVALLALTGASQAAIIADLGVDPNINLGRNPGAGFFDDQYTFQISADSTLTLASITNGFPGGIGSGQFIANFMGSVIMGTPGGVGNVTVIGPVAATSPCQNQTLCQALAGSALLDAGVYFLDLSGTAGPIASYGGTLSTLAAPVPGPTAGSFTHASVIKLFK
jgi:hypothetical protein